MVIWKNERSGGEEELLSWQIGGLTNYGAVIVYAKDRGRVWEVFCEVPGWERNQIEPVIPWRAHCREWLAAIGIRVNEDGFMMETLKKSPDEIQNEAALASIASRMGAGALCASYLTASAPNLSLGVAAAPVARARPASVA